MNTDLHHSIFIEKRNAAINEQHKVDERYKMETIDKMRKKENQKRIQKQHENEKHFVKSLK